MLVYAKLGEYKVNAPHRHGKLVKCTNKMLDYLCFCSKYQDMSVQK